MAVQYMKRHYLETRIHSELNSVWDVCVGLIYRDNKGAAPPSVSRYIYRRRSDKVWCIPIDIYKCSWKKMDDGFVEFDALTAAAAHMILTREWPV